MLMDWLEPAIEKRVEVISDICDDSNNDLYLKFMEAISMVKEHIPSSSEYVLSEIENIFNLKTHMIVNTSYRDGFADGLKLGKMIRTI